MNSYPYNVRIYLQYIYIYVCVYLSIITYKYIFTVFIYRVKYDDIRTCFTFSTLCYFVCFQHVVATSFSRKSATWQSGGDLLRLAQLEGHARTLTSSYKVRSRGIWDASCPIPRCQGKTGSGSPTRGGLT